MNHTIRENLFNTESPSRHLNLVSVMWYDFPFLAVVDLIEVPESQLAFIVQEEWSSEIIDTENPCPLPSFLRALHQCIEVSLSVIK